MEIQKLSTKLEDYLDSQNNQRTNHSIKNFIEINMGWETELFTFQSLFHENNKTVEEDLVLRIFSGEGAAKKASKEYYLMKKLHTVGYHVPPVYNLEINSEIIGKPFIIMKQIIGQTLDATYQNESLQELHEGVLKLVDLFVRLHNLDPAEFTDIPGLSSSDSIQRYLHYFRSTRDEFAKWMTPVIDWIIENMPKEPSFQSLCHLDYHGMNVMIDQDDQPYVIDWGASTIGDYRLDLSWTILLYSTFGGSMFRTPLIEFYQNISGKEIEGLEFFEVIAATRRISDLIRTTVDSDSVGLKPEVLKLMRDQKEHFVKVHGFLEDRTGLRLKEFDDLLDSF
jgi:aminoglycoside phosphotransferase (APT) family kinase protein